MTAEGISEIQTDVLYFPAHGKDDLKLLETRPVLRIETLPTFWAERILILMVPQTELAMRGSNGIAKGP